MAAHRHRTLRNRPGGARGRRTGMTLPELIVSVAILGIMVMTFGMAITTARKLVWGSQRTMTVNAEATAIARVLRDDLARMTKDGFLAIVAEDVQDKDSNDIPADHLVFTAVGTYRSLVDPTILAPAARIDYGLTAASLLWRRAVLLSPNPGEVRTEDNNSDDHEKFALEYYKLYSKPNLTAFVTGASTFTYPPPDNLVVTPYGTGVWTFNPMTEEPLNLTMSPNTKAELTDQWPQLANGVTSLKVEYMDAEGRWAARTVGSSLWWYEDADWPKALRIAFTLKLDMKRSTTTKEDVDNRDYRYEVIIHVPD